MLRRWPAASWLIVAAVILGPWCYIAAHARATYNDTATAIWR